jgi:hypothetical protein
LISDDLSTDQLMRCENAERILAKRREVLQSTGGEGGGGGAPSASLSLQSLSAGRSSATPPADADEAADDDTPRSVRLLLFVQVNLASRYERECFVMCVRRAFVSCLCLANSLRICNRELWNQRLRRLPASLFCRDLIHVKAWFWFASANIQMTESDFVISFNN